MDIKKNKSVPIKPNLPKPSPKPTNHFPSNQVKIESRKQKPFIGTDKKGNVRKG